MATRLSSPPLFSVSIQDGSNPPMVYHGHKLEKMSWVLLCEFQSAYLIYCWDKLCWKRIPREEFVKFKNNHPNLILKTGWTTNEWIDMQLSMPIEKVGKGHHKVIIRENEEIADLSEILPFINVDSEIMQD